MAAESAQHSQLAKVRHMPGWRANWWKGTCKGQGARFGETTGECLLTRYAIMGLPKAFTGVMYALRPAASRLRVGTRKWTMARHCLEGPTDRGQMEKS
jgi:hypothetical protein